MLISSSTPILKNDFFKKFLDFKPLHIIILIAVDMSPRKKNDFIKAFLRVKNHYIMEMSDAELGDYLLRSVISGNIRGVEIALNNGANPYTRRKSDFRSALQLAEGRGYDDISLLIRDTQRSTPKKDSPIESYFETKPKSLPTKLGFDLDSGKEDHWSCNTYTPPFSSSLSRQIAEV